MMSSFALASISTIQEIDTATIRALAKGISLNIRRIFLLRFLGGLVGTMICMIIALFFFLQHNTVLSLLIFAIGIFTPINNPFSLYKTKLIAQHEFKRLAQLQIASKSVGTIGTAAALLLTANPLLVGAIFFTLDTTINFIFFIKFTAQQDQPFVTGAHEKEAIGYGFHLSLIKMLSTISTNADKIIVWTFLSPIAVATYSVALAPISQIRAVLLNFNTLAFPKLARGSHEAISKTIFRKIIFFVVLLIPFVVLYWLLSPLLFRLLFPRYAESVPMTKILSIALLFIPFSILDVALEAQKKLKYIYTIRIATPIVRITLLFLLTYWYGLTGTAFAFVLSWLFYSMASMIGMRRA